MVVDVFGQLDHPARLGALASANRDSRGGVFALIEVETEVLKGHELRVGRDDDEERTGVRQQFLEEEELRETVCDVLGEFWGRRAISE